MKSVEGIILKKTPRREADSVFTLYTKEHGLMHLQAKGVRKQTAKLKAGLSVFNWVELFYVPAKYMPIATDFRIKDDFKVVKNNIKRLKLAS
ncbi:MAG: recombination protein O N-terminal domain-containing protein, partial [Parcubacteria group bacterium]|nr:recombination protein O N-terminal domain-containing protein [Parcubacteria group bacterium]